MKSKEQILSQIQNSTPLPSLPHVLIKLIDACDDENIPVSAIAPLVAQDSSISVKVLRLVNSSCFGLNRTFSDINQAVVYLGASSIRNLAITASVQQVFAGLKNGKEFNIDLFWYNSLLAASIARRLALATNHGNPEEAYMAGLLHNIGHLILFNSFPTEYELLQKKGKNGTDECSYEEQLIGITHCELGSWLLKNWKISPLIADATLYHHHSTDYIDEGFPLVKLTYLAGKLSDEQNGEHVNAVDLAHTLLGITPAQLEEVTERAKEEVIEIAQNLEICISPPKVVAPHETRNNDKQHSHGVSTLSTSEESKQTADVQKALIQLVENSSLLTSFCQNLVQKDDQNSILAATEEIVRILWTSKTVFFLLYDTENKALVARTSSKNPEKDLFQGLVIQESGHPSLAIRSLLSERILTASGNSGKPINNLADEQIFNIANSASIKYLPMLVKKERIGVIVLSHQADLLDDSEQQRDQMKLVANQTAIALHINEIRRKETQKIQAERMATASLAARKVVHEVNNPLGIISNYLKLLEIKIPKEQGVQQELQIINEEISRISNIVEELNSFSTTAPTLHTATLSVNEILQQMLRILDATLLEPRGISLIFNLAPSLAVIDTEKNKLKQILINLVKNAAEAMVEGGSIAITTSNIVARDKVMGVRIDIRDDGPGIPEKIKNNLFSPFMTTKSHGHSGLGLSVAHKTIQDLGGTIECETTKEQGTCFTLSLPLNYSLTDNSGRV
jgi:nitrogen-specific signal transduction histidine kinase/HD-like signal output (HDOD) protein